jgi:hypothetical protein
MVCTYNADDETNPFSSCNEKLNTLNTTVSTLNANLSNDLYDSTTGLYSKYKSYIAGGFINSISLGGTTFENAATDTVKTGYEDGQTAVYTANNTNLKNRAILDAKVSFLSSDKNKTNSNDDSLLYNAYFYVNMLWIILATSLILYVFTEIY